MFFSDGRLKADLILNLVDFNSNHEIAFTCFGNEKERRRRKQSADACHEGCHLLFKAGAIERAVIGLPWTICLGENQLIAHVGFDVSKWNTIACYLKHLNSKSSPWWIEQTSNFPVFRRKGDPNLYHMFPQIPSTVADTPGFGVWPYPERERMTWDGKRVGVISLLK